MLFTYKHINLARVTPDEKEGKEELTDRKYFSAPSHDIGENKIKLPISPYPK